jgi:geranylgeranyl diphosphate synthase type II
LHTQAFIALSELDAKRYDAEAVIKVMRLIAEATGCAGMIGGQVIDIQSEGKLIDFERLKKLHRLKTGALIRASVMAPAVLARVGQEELGALTRFGEAIGLCFQIADDILDIEGGEAIGKDIGSDIEKGKATYPSILGMVGAKSELQKQLQEALAALDGFDAGADALRAIARFIAERKT